MPVSIIIGGQWGDEAKGKITDVLAARAQMVIRPNGSTNAGHTVVTDQGTFKFHLVPAGILYPGCTCVISAGVAINPAELISELDELRAAGLDLSRLFISDRAQVIMPYHPLFDRLEEERRGAQSVGTTLKGNGPAYTDKVARSGVRVGDLLDEAALSERLRLNVPAKNVVLSSLYNHPPLDLSRMLEEYAAYAEQLAPYVRQTELLVQDAIAEGETVLVEGAQATMLDLDYGTYPYVTSTAPTAAGACQGAGIGPTQVDDVIGVFKAYATRVGAGPFPTEIPGRVGEELRARGAEYGTTTGRPRRVGWFDGVAARYTARLNGMTRVALTKFDVLDTLAEVPIGTGYRLDAADLAAPPSTAEAYARVQPIYEMLPGWRADTSEATTLADLPAPARRYIDRIEEIIGVEIRWVGTGPHRRQIIGRPGLAD